MRGEDQVMLARMDRNIANGNGRKITRELRPLLPAVYGNEEAKFSSQKKQVRVHAVFANHVRVALKRIIRERLPRLAEIRRLEDVNFHVARLVAVESHIRRSAIK